MKARKQAKAVTRAAAKPVDVSIDWNGAVQRVERIILVLATCYIAEDHEYDRELCSAALS